MKTLHLLTLSLVAIMMLSMNEQLIDIVQDYLGMGKEVVFNDKKYILSWSSNPSTNYYKQEYLINANESNPKRSMIITECLDANISLNDAVEYKKNELDKRKKWDFVANYTVYTNEDKKDEAIIDFVISDTMTNYEWNLYRFQKQKGKDNKSRLVLFAYSFKDSLNDNSDLKVFFDNIKNNRVKMINSLQSFKIPVVTILKN